MKSAFTRRHPASIFPQWRTNQMAEADPDRQMTEDDPDRPITFNKAAKYLPEDCRPCDATWWRWWKKGIRGIRLQTLLIGGRRYTTAAAVQEWITKVTAAANGEPPAVRTPRQRLLAIERAERELTPGGASSSKPRQATGRRE
jgi:hypothetical protein